MVCCTDQPITLVLSPLAILPDILFLSKEDEQKRQGKYPIEFENSMCVCVCVSRSRAIMKHLK